MNRIIIHVDMDAFYAAVEIRDNPSLAGKPLIIGALPGERGVVSTCSYEARKFGVRSAMSIQEAYRRCPDGVYMHPNMQKYKAVSHEIHKIWNCYTDIVEYLSLDEGYLDVTGSAHLFGGAKNICFAIKDRTKSLLGLTCSVGIGYSMMTAKLASEEKKPDGFFEIPNPQALMKLISERSVKTIYSIGSKTAEKLRLAGVHTVRDIHNNSEKVISLLGNHGMQIVELANGIDNRSVTPYSQAQAKSIGREHTFQQDITDASILQDALLLIAKDLSLKTQLEGIYSHTITLKITYRNMKSITRSKSGNPTNKAQDIYKTALSMLDMVEKRPIRLVGISLGGLSKSSACQLTLDDMNHLQSKKRKDALDDKLLNLQRKYGPDIIKTGSELAAKQRFKTDHIT